jgi:thiazole synthase
VLLDANAARDSVWNAGDDLMVKFYDREFSSRLLIGSALYPSPAIMQAAIRASGADIVTVSVRRESAGGKTGHAFW